MLWPAIFVIAALSIACWIAAGIVALVMRQRRLTASSGPRYQRRAAL